MEPGMWDRGVGTDLDQAIEKIQEHWRSNIAHEFSNPLFAARGYVRMLLERRADETEKRFLTAALENIDKLVTLTQELEDFPTKNVLVLERLSLTDLLRDVINDITSESAAKGVRFAPLLATEGLGTIGDPQKLRQAMRSFCATLTEFTAPGGVIEIVAYENAQELIVQFGTDRHPSALGMSLPDLSIPRKLLKLHGASTAIRYSPEGRYSVVCELPAIRLPKCLKCPT